MEVQNLVDALIAYWNDGPKAVDEATRKVCREVAGVLARSMSGSELLELQEAPAEHRRDLEMRVGMWVAMTGGPCEDPAPAGGPTRNLSLAPPSLSPQPPAPEPEPPPRPEPAREPVRSSPPPPEAASRRETPTVQVRQSNTGGGVNLGHVDQIQGGFHFGAPFAGGGAGTAPATEAAAPAESQRVRILFLGANPSDSVPLRLDEEVRTIEQALTRGEVGGRCELSQRWAVRVTDLQEALLRTKPHILHFSGHGSPDRTLVLKGDDGTSRPVDAALLGRLLSRFSQRLRCVVLNACYTEEYGRAIAEHIDCVVGMARPVSDRAAIRFSAAFYLAVASGCSVEDAFEQARADIELGELHEETTPVLLSRRTDAARLFLVKA